MKKLLVIIITLSSLFTGTVIADELRVAKAELDKAWGLLIGDVITMTVELPVASTEIDASSLPHIDKRYGDWLYIRQVTLADKLSIEFQLVNVPPVTTDVMTPSLTFRLLDGEFINVESLPMTIGPIIAEIDKEAGQKPKLKPAHSPGLIDTSVLKQNLFIAIVVAVVTAVIVLIWNMGWRPRNRQPFAEAAHGLRMLRWQHGNDPQHAVRIVHKAFNNTANKTVVHSELDYLFTAAPWLNPLQQEINAFYLQSSQHFFSPDSGAMPDVQDLKKLVKACRAKEKLA